MTITQKITIYYFGYFVPIKQLADSTITLNIKFSILKINNMFTIVIFNYFHFYPRTFFLPVSGVSSPVIKVSSLPRLRLNLFRSASPAPVISACAGGGSGGGGGGISTGGGNLGVFGLENNPPIIISLHNRLLHLPVYSFCTS
jgi:hypothetical protein